jgi:hypothetical protein
LAMASSSVGHDCAGKSIMLSRKDEIALSVNSLSWVTVSCCSFYSALKIWLNASTPLT